MLSVVEKNRRRCRRGRNISVPSVTSVVRKKSRGRSRFYIRGIRVIRGKKPWPWLLGYVAVLVNTSAMFTRLKSMWIMIGE